MGGEIDLDNAHELRDQLGSAMCESHSPTVVDPSAVEFIDSSGLVALIDARRDATKFDSNLVCGRTVDRLSVPVIVHDPTG